MKLLLTALTILALISGLFAQPTWSVNPDSYQHSMTITGAISIEATESLDQNDIVGVFADTVCRGVASPIYESSLGRYLVYMMVYSNIAQGDTLSIKIYDASEDTIYTAINELTFTAENIIGTPTNPYIFDYHTLNAEAEIINFSFAEQIASANINNIQHTVEIEVADTANLENLTANFTLSNQAVAYVNDSLQESGITTNDFSTTVIYTVFSEDGLTEQEWQIFVDQDTLNTEAQIIDFSFTEQINSATINTQTNNIYIDINANANINSLIASFTLSENAQTYVNEILQESNLTINNFELPIVYKVISEDSLTEKYWTVIVSQATTNIENNNKENQLTIFPNPSKKQLSIVNYKLPITNVEIYDITGKKVIVANKIINNNLKIENLKTGIYFLKVGNSVCKFIKE